MRKVLSADRNLAKRNLVESTMKPYSAKITRSSSKEAVSNQLLKDTKKLKINRSSQFSHIVPKKPTSSLQGAWILWVILGLLLTAAVLLPPKIKLILFDGHRYHPGSDLPGDLSQLSIAPLRKLYTKQQEWVVLGLDQHLCEVLKAIEAEGESAVGIAPKKVATECGEPQASKIVSLSVPTRTRAVEGNSTSGSSLLKLSPNQFASALVGEGNSTQGGETRSLAASTYDVVLIVGSEISAPQTGLEGRRAIKVVEALAREAIRLAKRDVIVLEPDGIAKDKRQPWTELSSSQGCKRDKDNTMTKEQRKGLSGFTMRLYFCSTRSPPTPTPASAGTKPSSSSTKKVAVPLT